MNLNSMSTDHLSFAIRLVSCYLQGMTLVQHAFSCSGWPFLEEVRTFSFELMSLNLPGFFPRCICFSLVGRAWMVGDAVFPIWQGSLLKEVVHPK